MSTFNRHAIVCAVNQDEGIDPDRNKGAAVHLNAMRKAFSGLGAQCLAFDEPDDTSLTHALGAALEKGPVDLIYERYALGKSAAARFAAKNDIPLIIEVNSPLADEQKRWRGSSDPREDARQDAFALAHAHMVIAVSSEVAHYARQRGAAPGRVKVFPNGIDVDRFNPSARSDSIRKSLIPDGRFVIGFHGRERPWHGFDLLTDIFARLLACGHDVHLLVVGEGSFESLAKLPGDRYTRIGWQAHENMPKYVAAFDVLPLTYHADMPCYFSPLKLMEAMGCGVVPVVPDLGDLAEVVNHRQTGLVYTAGNNAQLLKLLESLISDRNLMHGLGRQASMEAEKHSWARIAQNVLEFAAVGNPEELNTPLLGSRNNSLQQALEALKTLGLEPAQVRRVAVERKGLIHVEVHEAEKHRFFEYQKGELRESQPDHDPKIPFLKKSDDQEIANGREIISYRPGRRIVLGAEAIGAPTILKAYKRHQVTQAAEKYRLALSACASGGFDIPKLLKVDVDQDYLLIEKRTGHLPLITPGSVSTWSGIGVNLRCFQQYPVGDELPGFDSSEELAVLDERARRFLLCVAALPKRWQEGRERLEKAAAGLPDASVGLAHRDLHDRQFIISGDLISLLDFDLVCKADVALDAANLLAHMKLRTLQDGIDNGDVSALEDCSNAFLTGLGRQDEPGFYHRLLFYQASTYYRLALLYALRPRWTHLADRLIDEGELCIDTLDQLRTSS